MTIKQNIRVTKGEVEGRVLERSRGKGGFGYDPHFLVGETDLTFAEMSDQEKKKRQLILK